MADEALVFRYNVEATRARELSLTMSVLEEHAFDIPLEHMRAWLSHFANGEFDALPLDRRDH